MGQIAYSKFIKKLDKKFAAYFQFQSDYICCKKGCSFCGEKGDYPFSDIELQYYSTVYEDRILKTEPIKENLDTQNLLKEFGTVEIRNLYD